jgi:predicted DCC family thiol-disulfide oxidoreductase YuxK
MKTKGVKPMGKSLLVFYDGYCPLCRNSKKAIEKADWLSKIDFLSFRDPDVMETYGLYGKNPEERMIGIRLGDRETYEGIETILQIVARVPLYWVFVPFLFIAVKIGLGQPAYDFIAKRRKIIPVGQCDEQGCPVHFRQTNDDRNEQ